MEVAELEGARLDYWVAAAGEVWKTAHELFPAWTIDPTFKGVEIVDEECWLIPNNLFRQDPKRYSPSSDWSQGGIIIEREKIKLEPIHKLKGGEFLEWNAKALPWQYAMEGPTALIAAMRAFVASRFGLEVDDC